MMITRTNRSILFSALCVIIGIITATVGSVRTFAEASEPVTYIQDIKMFQGDSASEARSYFSNIGYTIIENDLNRGTDTGKYVYIGYKTTTDKQKALTDIRMMAMDTGYQTYDYKGISDYLASQQDGTAQMLFSTANEFISNYETGSPKALEAYEGLNLFDIGDPEKTKLGDYIINGEADKDFFVQMLLKSSAGAMNNVIGLLNIGIAPYENGYDMDTQTTFTANWAERIATSSLWDDYSAGLTEDEEEELHLQYNDLAKKLFSAIQDFTTLYENAAARYNESDVLNNEKFQSEDDAVENMDTISQEETDLLYIASYDTLNQYNFNENLKLGEWIVSLGRQTSENVDMMQIYPIVEAMTDNQVEIVARTGLISAISNLGENTELTEYEKQLDNSRDAIREYNNSTSISLWDVEGDDIENSNIALTSDAIRKQSAQQSLGKISSLEILDEKIQNALKWINIAIGAAFVVVGVAEVALRICLLCSAAASTFSTFCVTALSVVSWASLGLMVISVAVIAFQLIYSLIIWIIELVREKVKDLNHTVKPDYIFDAPETANGTITVKYKSVINDSGSVGDLNASKQYKWCLLAYTTDTRVGSPIRTDSFGKIFKVIEGDSSRQNGYDCVKFFGERNAANTNAYCESDSHDGCYIHYRTDYSISNEASSSDSSGETSGEGNTYIKDLIISVGKDTAEAKAKITAKESSYYILDSNLSSNCSFATYIGYTITNDKTKAVKDIRVQPYAGKPEGVPTLLGDISYNYVENIGVRVAIGDEQTRPQADALYYTTDEAAGSPILADGLHIVRSFKDVKPGWEPVSLFCADYPYDFQTSFETISMVNHPFISGYTVNKSNTIANHKGTYFYYEPETKYTSGTKYLSGFFFIGGRDYKTNYNNNQLEEKYSTLVNYAKSIPNAVLAGNNADEMNLASSINHSVDFGPGTGGYWINLVYTYTYNPNRAIYDAAIYQGTFFSDALPYSVSKMSETDTKLNYVACSFISQQSYQYGKVSRYISTGNSFKDSGGVNLRDRDYETMQGGHTVVSAFAQNVQYGYDVSDYMPTGLYVLGKTDGMEPLLLSDVVVTNKSIQGTVQNKNILFDVSSLNTLAGTKATGEFHSIFEMKNPHSTEPYDLCYGNYYNYEGTETDPDRAGIGSQTCNLFIYLRNPQADKPKYIASLSVGSFSRKQYLSKYPSSDENVLRGIDTITDGQALQSAMAGCVDEVIYSNFATAHQSDAWYNKCDSEGKADRSAPENNVAAYIGVTRTDRADKAIKGVLLYELDDTVAPNVLKLENVQYVCAGSQSPIEMNGKTYFLYYTTNSGVAPCAPITEIMIDDFPMAAGYSTNLSGDTSHDAPYGNPNQTNFIHLKYDKEERGIFNKIYIGKGATKHAALCDLLSQGCFEYIDMDLNKGVQGESIYMGFRSKYIDWDTINMSATEAKREAAIEKALLEAVYDIILTRDEEFKPDGFVNKTNNVFYYPVSDCDLTGGAGDKIYMYYCCPYYSNNYNNKNMASTSLPGEVFSGYYKQIGISNYDRVPYNTSLAGAEDSSESVMRWEYIMFSDNSRPANPNAGTLEYTYEGNYALDNRVTLFAQRSDGSIKPEGEITGGFVEETMQVGSIVLNY